MRSRCPLAPRVHGAACAARGFTLIELMIVVAVAAILAVLSTAGYQNYLERARRSEARAFLLEAAARMERYRSTQGAYIDEAAKLGYADGALSPEKYYTLEIDLNAGPQYLLTVTPNGFVDTDCTSLTYNSRKQKGFAGDGSFEICWGRRQ